MDRSLVMAKVDEHMSHRHRWGLTDCCTSAITVVSLLHRVPNPMALFLGQYHSREAAIQLAESFGGFRPMIHRLTSQADWQPVTLPEPGDLGVQWEKELGSLLVYVGKGLWAGKSLMGYTLLTRSDFNWRPRR